VSNILYKLQANTSLNIKASFARASTFISIDNIPIPKNTPPCIRAGFEYFEIMLLLMCCVLYLRYYMLLFGKLTCLLY
jgi:hypothetical protein